MKLEMVIQANKSGIILPNESEEDKALSLARD